MADPKTLIIAEAGVNHNGNLDTAIRLIDAAAEAGADMVKFQTFNAAMLATASAIKADYQKRTTEGGETQLAMLTRLQLSEDAHHALIARCAEKDITFLSTALRCEANPVHRHGQPIRDRERAWNPSLWDAERR